MWKIPLKCNEADPVGSGHSHDHCCKAYNGGKYTPPSSPWRYDYDSITTLPLHLDLDLLLGDHALATIK
ncbi:hypothetical protein TSUD_343140 [Trifolium subterraneum]|nr:hypothetical protein TSUD_343140 [Trifolium subterraneum]